MKILYEPLYQFSDEVYCYVKSWYQCVWCMHSFPDEAYCNENPWCENEFDTRIFLMTKSDLGLWLFLHTDCVKNFGVKTNLTQQTFCTELVLACWLLVLICCLYQCCNTVTKVVFLGHRLPLINFVTSLVVDHHCTKQFHEDTSVSNSDWHSPYQFWFDEHVVWIEKTWCQNEFDTREFW